MNPSRFSKRGFASGLIVLLIVGFANRAAAEDSVLFVSGSHSNAAKVQLLIKDASDLGIKIARINAMELPDAADAKLEFAKHRLVIFDGVSSRDNKMSFERFLPHVVDIDTQFMAMKDRDNAYLKGLTPTHAQTISDYYLNGGRRNLNRLLDYFRYRVIDGNETQNILPPVIYPSAGIYHPDYQGLIFNTREEYFDWLNTTKAVEVEGKPVIGVLLQRASIEIIQTGVIDETVEQIEAQGAIALPFFFELSPFSKDYSSLLQAGDETAVDIILNFRLIHWANKRKAEFEKFGVPVMQALTYFDGDSATWEQDIQGISPAMTSFMLVLPEAAGVIDPFTVAAFPNFRTADEQKDSAKWQTIDYQLEHLVTKAIRMVALKYKNNADKKLAVMVWGDEDIGASFLNVPDSLHTLAHRLNKEGYTIEPYEHDFYSDRAKAILEPFYRDDRLGSKLTDLVDQDLAELLPLDEYMKWFNALPERITKPVIEYWGHPKDNFMSIERDGNHYMVVPRIKNGNMLVMRQPPRADDKEEDERIYHDQEVPINHFYLAGYYFAREHWQSDAIVHYGTHGSQEYLYGKERVPSIYDHPNLAVWDTPVLYPFIVDDVGEAMQTKRRGRATVISHMTPPFAAAGLQGELADIHNLMHEYNALDAGGVKVKTGKQIVETCFEHNICDDMGVNRKDIAADFPAFLKQLHDYMNEISGMSQPLGLHSFGELPRQELVTSTIVQMLGSKFIAEAAAFERDHYQTDVHDGAHSHGDHKAHDHSTGDHDHAHDNNADHGFHETKQEISELSGFKTVRDYVVSLFSGGEQHGHSHDEHHDQHDDKHHHDKPPMPLEDIPEALQKFVATGKEYYENMMAIEELDNTVAFLNGKYIRVKSGGDPLRHPESLPTGTNLYGFDPARVPTKAAYEQGAELAEQIIAEYYQKHGRYPDKLAFTLWSIETMRQYGVLEGQALAAMGMRPVWSDDGRVIDSEIIEYAELKRPRVDVVLSATGLYRDAFPNIMQFLARAVEKLATLKEEGNNIYHNSQRIAEELKQEGIEEKDAVYLSTVRIFSNAPGKHGSGVDEATFASDTWENDKKIADVFLSRMGYYYGSDNRRYGKKLEHINVYAKQLSGTDIALHSRSSNLYGLLSTDDPFEYFGGLSLAVRNLDGKSPEMIINNLRDVNRARPETADKFLSKELRTRNFHPRWITEMMEEGYSGAVEMSGRIDNFWGWQVVDPEIVREDQWQSFYEVYIEDSLDLGLQEFFEKVNPNAQARMLERMLEAVRKEYWQADEETIRKMVERYVEIVEQFDHYVDNEKLREYVNLSANGFGLDMNIPAPDAASAPGAAAEPQAVEGQQLEKVQEPESAAESPRDWLLIAAALVMILFVLIGMIRQGRFEKPVTP
ncbi:MAG: cobaltochelatase subunit CobN [Pseudomonadota bacterium]